MARETTRKINQRVVAALEAVVNAADGAAAEVNRTQRALSEVAAVTRLHDDLLDDAEVVMERLESLRELIGMRLRAERDGESR
jgi:lipopolysaccharide biosynthesis regulator YciM